MMEAGVTGSVRLGRESVFVAGGGGGGEWGV